MVSENVKLIIENKKAQIEEIRYQEEQEKETEWQWKNWS